MMKEKTSKRWDCSTKTQNEEGQTEEVFVSRRVAHKTPSLSMGRLR